MTDATSTPGKPNMTPRDELEALRDLTVRRTIEALQEKPSAALLATAVKLLAAAGMLDLPPVPPSGPELMSLPFPPHGDLGRVPFPSYLDDK
ncbi:MAG TPA: hypothetical protein VKY65_14605 [Alphaproteobacteria bacterium]|nr:hypothetical protein [Alphaproteobacteria bacterium]